MAVAPGPVVAVRVGVLIGPVGLVGLAVAHGGTLSSSLLVPTVVPVGIPAAQDARPSGSVAWA